MAGSCFVTPQPPLYINKTRLVITSNSKVERREYPSKSALLSSKSCDFECRVNHLHTWQELFQRCQWTTPANRGHSILQTEFCNSSPLRKSTRFLHDKTDRTFPLVPLVIASAAPAAPAGSKLSQFVFAFYKFIRPHTIRGTILAVIAGTGRGLYENRSLIDWGLTPKALLGLLCLLCGNAFIVGMNQIFDIDIDKVNKPYLPMASGEIGPKLGWALVLGCGIFAHVAVFKAFSPLIFKLFALGTFLGIIYSIPPFRTKQNPFLAAITIAIVRGFLLNFGVYYATTEALGVPFAWNPPVMFLTFFMTVFALVIAVTKDLPDCEGDEKYNIMTFAVQMGPRRLLNIAVGMLCFNYITAMMLPLIFKKAFRAPVMILGHAAVMATLLHRVKSVDLKSQNSITKFYGFIWKLFYTEFALYPFI